MIGVRRLIPSAFAHPGRAILPIAAVTAWLCAPVARAQDPPFDARPEIAPPHYRVRYEAGTDEGALALPATFTVWIPPGVERLRGIVVHQHGCGTGSTSSGLTGAHDLHWQALAAKHDCALVAPAYEQPDALGCQLWCDPWNGSAEAFLRALADLGRQSGHPELPFLPWALWGHSGGGRWAGAMACMFPERTVAVWLRSGVPPIAEADEPPESSPLSFPDAARAIPMVCNLGVKEGVREVDEPFKHVWPANERFFHAVRSRGGLIAVAIDPLSSHDCGNQRYLAIPWLDACLTARLPAASDEPRPPEPLRSMEIIQGWFAPIDGGMPVPADRFSGDALSLGWLPDEAIAGKWTAYVKDTMVPDDTPPPAPTHVVLADGRLTWDAVADLESGLAGFVIVRDGKRIATLPENPHHPFGRPLFQRLQYSDTPPLPLPAFEFTDPDAAAESTPDYRVIAVNSVGLESAPSAQAQPAAP